MAGNKALNAAAKAKQDEFYTQLADIENELKHYRNHFKGKTVLCNCDDPFESNFFKYFVLNFNKLSLKKLIATSYATSQLAGTQFSYHIDDNGQMSFTFGGNKNNAPLKKAYKAVVNAVYDKTGNKYVEMEDVAELFKSGENELTELEGDGDFRSEECIEILKQADIVCTNPPFSLLREYVAQLMEYAKDFVIIGNQNARHYKDIFPLLKEGKIWIGYNSVSEFVTPTGTKKFGNIGWYTNLDIKKHHEDLILYKRYSAKEYQKYYNYDAINVDKVSDIPCDYAGEMGVPDNFLDVYNPDQFELIGLGPDVPKTKEHVSINGETIVYKQDGKVVWSTPYTVPERKLGNSLRIDENGGPGRAPYNRIIIRNKHPKKPGEA